MYFTPHYLTLNNVISTINL